MAERRGSCHFRSLSAEIGMRLERPFVSRTPEASRLLFEKGRSKRKPPTTSGALAPGLGGSAGNGGKTDAWCFWNTAPPHHITIALMRSLQLWYTLVLRFCARICGVDFPVSARVPGLSMLVADVYFQVAAIHETTSFLLQLQNTYMQNTVSQIRARRYALYDPERIRILGTTSEYHGSSEYWPEPWAYRS
ncbi:hypothetical protein N658DRAFT_183790 [Parathielavia hyrcaniae]|uniref:Uncharacterized protein n=1 Tax=Parathielavia hyrcaniae TaxID=113614 RepID=A0AAN6Q808_9PEZI|nr:hypothetical protein N658DRAFT_183790 [Parathielavia hyrcaniae]